LSVSFLRKLSRQIIDRARSRLSNERPVVHRKSGILDITLDHLPERAASRLRQSLYAHNAQLVGKSNYRDLHVALRDSDKRIVGGLLGSTYWEWFVVDCVWIDPDYRGQHHSARLFEAAEQTAVQRGCRYACLETYTFQGKLGLYQSLGYEVLDAVDDFPPGHRRFFLKKTLRVGTSF